jgi:hypothetical protein
MGYESLPVAFVDFFVADFVCTAWRCADEPTPTRIARLFTVAELAGAQ